MYRVWEQGGTYYIERKTWFGWSQVYDVCIDEVSVPRSFCSKKAACEHVAAMNDRGRPVECV